MSELDPKRHGAAFVSRTPLVWHGSWQSVHHEQQSIHQSEPAYNPTTPKVYACQMRMVVATVFSELFVMGVVELSDVGISAPPVVSVVLPYTTSCQPTPPLFSLEHTDSN